MRKSLLRATAGIGLGLIFVAPTTSAAKPVAPPRRQENVSNLHAAPQDVHVGAYVMHIHEVNIRENYFIADLYVWFRWNGDQLKPYKTFSLVDARKTTKMEPVTAKMPDGSNYAYVRIVATVTKFWDLRRYPLDRHDLDINIEEDNDEDNLVHYVADEENSGADESQISMPGWKLVKANPITGLGVYRSNFGDISLPKDRVTRYSRLTLRMSFVRDSHLVFLKLLFGVWVGAGISFVAFFIRPKFVDPRLGVGVGAIFAAIASEYIVNESLPDTNTATLADRLHVVAFAFIFASIIESTVSLYLVENGRELQSKRLDLVSRWVFPTSFALINALTVLWA